MSRHLLRLLRAVPDAGSDGDLLRRVAAGNDPLAFELLVRRHADAVWAACLRVARHEADAEDAFQATFLVLAKKAATVRGPCAGGWLHRVAVNAALKRRIERGRVGLASVEPSGRRADESHVALTPRRSPEAAAERAELAAAVHEELARLPEKYRLAVVLCDLEGHTHAEAAKALGWPVGTVSGRLSRARELLRQRFERRGIGAPSLVVLPLAAPPELVRRLVSVAAGGVVPPAVQSLTLGVLAAMRTAKLKLTAAVAAGLLGLAGVGTVTAVAMTNRGGSGEPAGTAPVVEVTAAEQAVDRNAVWVPEKWDDPVPSAFPELKPPVYPWEELDKACPRLLGKEGVAIEPADGTYRRLLKAQLQQSRLELIHRFPPDLKPENHTAIHRCLGEIRTTVSELYAENPKVLIPWLEELVVMWKGLEQVADRIVASKDPGDGAQRRINLIRRHRLEAEAALWKAKNSPPPPAAVGR